MNDVTKLAETLFIDMVNGKSNMSMNEVEEIAISSFQYATMFYSKVNSVMEDEKSSTLSRVKGCPKCYGSGGKSNNPCKYCRGTGKIAVPV